MSRVYTISVSAIVSKVRTLLQDSDPTAYRQGDAELIGWLNDALSSIATLQPGLFSVGIQHVCGAGHVQTITHERAHMLVDVVGVPQADLGALSAFLPAWQNASQGAIQNWMPVPGSPLSFYCYPPSADGQAITATIIQSPGTLSAMTDVVSIPESFKPALVDYVTSMAQLKDDESIDSGRYQQLMANFATRIKGA